MTGQGVSRTNSRDESEVTTTVRHPEILICLSSGDQNALLTTKCFQTFCFMDDTILYSQCTIPLCYAVLL
jgi:hypothetical protein